MKSRYVIGMVVLGFFGGSGIASGVELTTACGPDEEALRRVIANYVASVESADADLASTVWATRPDVSFIHPRGHERGWDAIKTHVIEQLMGETFTKRSLTVKDVAIHCHGENAWSEFYWDFAATLRKDGSSIETHGRETQIYEKVDGSWRLVHVHYSGMPITREGEGF